MYEMCWLFKNKLKKERTDKDNDNNVWSCKFQPLNNNYLTGLSPTFWKYARWLVKLYQYG